LIGVSAAGMTALINLVKKIIDKSLDGAIEGDNAVLLQDPELYKHTSNKESENLKFMLNKITPEHQTKAKRAFHRTRYR